MKDICLYYAGACGGFYALTLLSLVTPYKWLPKSNWSRHWHIESMETWKSTEQWPNNQETSESDINHKLFFICNPDKRQLKKIKAMDGVTSIWLYTDVKTQLILSWHKKAWKNHSIHWPPCDSFEEVLNEYYIDQNMYKWDNHIVWKNDYWKYCDQAHYLQDVIKTAGDSLLRPLGYASNKACQKFTDYWISLHNEECQKLLK